MQIYRSTPENAISKNSGVFANTGRLSEQFVLSATLEKQWALSWTTVGLWRGGRETCYDRVEETLGMTERALGRSPWFLPKSPGRGLYLLYFSKQRNPLSVIKTRSFFSPSFSPPVLFWSVCTIFESVLLWPRLNFPFESYVYCDLKSPTCLPFFADPVSRDYLFCVCAFICAPRLEYRACAMYGGRDHQTEGQGCLISVERKRRGARLKNCSYFLAFYYVLRIVSFYVCFTKKIIVIVLQVFLET